MSDVKIWRRARVSAEVKNSPNYHLSIDEMVQDIAEERTELWHYTNVSALLKILLNKSIRFSRIDCVNDLTEKENILVEDIYLRTYVACFNHNPKESIPMWRMYTTVGNGIRIGLKFKTGEIHNSIVGIYEGGEFSDKIYLKRMTDIVYSDVHAEKYSPIIPKDDDGKINVIFDEMAFLKSSIWEYEEETRMVVLFKESLGDNPPRHIDFKIDFNRIDTISIVFDPWMSDEVKKCIELGVKHYCNDYIDKINFNNSDLQGMHNSDKRYACTA